MAKEWYQNCKDCGKRFGYSDFSYQADLRRGHSRPERCPEHREQHELEIRNIASSHFALTPRQGPPPILGLPYLGHVSHGERRAPSVEEREADRSQMDIGITDSDIEDVYGAMKECQVLVIVGPTGSGKSTYVPYRLIDPLPPFDMDHFTQHGPVIVTQPRIQATRGIPDAVGNLLLGSSVGPGFEIGFRHGDQTGGRRGDQHDSRNRLIFVTDGTLLNWITGGRIGDFSAIMIDEAHERSCNIDLILGLIKRELLKYPYLKLIVASATIDADRFVEYFREVTTVRLLEFEGKRNNGYELHWWTGTPIDYKAMPKKMAEKVLRILKETDDGGILGFLPGQKEIDEAVGLIKEALKGPQDVRVFPLYTALGVKSNREALKRPNKVKVGERTVTPRRVVIATNVAETSITIPDIVYVVDSGYIKQTEWNSSTCRQELRPREHSKDGCKQRWGRAGRVRCGDVYTLYTKEKFDSFADHTPPEITRECMDDVLLTAKAAGITRISSFSWIDSPLEREMNRAMNVILERELVDLDSDLTEEGLELYHLSRSVSRYLDKYDYNSTKRSLDVAALLTLADRHACLIEAITALVMMPRLGNSSYWKDDGLFLWDKLWDLESKDRVARIHLALKTGCRDDLDFACKLYALYEQRISPFPNSHLRHWGERQFINARNFRLLDEARHVLLEAFTRGKKDLAIRPIDFSLIPRVRILMAVAWPDRIVDLIRGNPTRFKLPGSDEVGVVSDLSCGLWEKREKAIVGITGQVDTVVDGKKRICPVANFLIGLPESLPSRDAADIASSISALREMYKQGDTYAQLLADQYAPVGSKVIVDMSDDAVRIVQVSSLPDEFAPTTDEAHEEDEEESADSHDLYEHGPVDTDDADEIGTDTEDGWDMDEIEPPTSKEHSVVDVEPEKVPELNAGWANNMSADKAVLTEWTGKNGQPLAVIDAVDQSSIRAEFPKRYRVGAQIELNLVRQIRDMSPCRLVGYMGLGPDGILIPIPVEDLTISLKNPALDTLQGATARFTVVSTESPKGYPVVSLLPNAETDLNEILKLEEVEGQIIDILDGRLYVAIYRDGGILHVGSLPLDVALKILPNPSLGQKVFIQVKFKVYDDRIASVPIGDRSLRADLSSPDLHELCIGVGDGRLTCARRLSHNDLLHLKSSYPALAHNFRELYARSYDLHIEFLDTAQSRKTCEEFYLKACRIRDRANVSDPESIQMEIKNMRTLLETRLEKEFSYFKRSRSYAIVPLVLDEAWELTKYRKQKDAIERRKAQIVDLERRIATSYNDGYKTDARGWIKEKREKILQIEQSVSVTLQKIEGIRAHLREIGRVRKWESGARISDLGLRISDLDLTLRK